MKIKIIFFDDEKGKSKGCKNMRDIVTLIELFETNFSIVLTRKYRRKFKVILICIDINTIFFNI